ncbi:MAG TPA: hemerythrin domain-containing protein [Candidatus Binataceae bacterium]|nr:hemerythrin domain-containing protein [Candidatus Binataceae bacterium]
MESLQQFLTDDHRRLDALLERTGNCASAEELAAYDSFRRGILKHIGIEEKIMLTAAARLHGAPLEQAARLRLDHGAIVSLLMPLPTPAIIHALRTVLSAHNPIEEGDAGVYDVCDKLTISEHDELMAKVHAAPEVPTNQNATSPRILDAARHALARAGYDPALIDG